MLYHNFIELILHGISINIDVQAIGLNRNSGVIPANFIVPLQAVI